MMEPVDILSSQIRLPAGYMFSLSLCLLAALVTFPQTSFALNSGDQDPSGHTKRINIGVLDFQPMGDIDEDQVYLITQEFRSALRKHPQFAVMERERMLQIASEQQFQVSGACRDDECAVQIGMILNIEKMVAGNIYRTANDYIIQARIIDVETSEVERDSRVTFQGSLIELLNATVLQTAVAQLSLQGDPSAFTSEELRALNPTSGRLVLISDPVSVVIVNGNRQGMTPRTLVLDPGTYDIRFETNGYNATTRPINLFAGASDTISVKLTPRPGILRIISNPRASLFINETRQGRTPQNVTLAPRTHDVRLELDGYGTYNRRIQVSPGANDTLFIEMEPLPAHLSLRCTPSGAKVFVNGVERGVTPLSLTLQAGQYNVRVEMLDYYDLNLPNIRLDRGETETYMNRMRPLEKRRLRIETDPLGAEVLIDSIAVGITPIRRIELTRRPHLVEFKLDGYDSVRYTLPTPPTSGLLSQKLLESGEARLVLNSIYRGAQVEVRHRTGDQMTLTPTDTISVRPGLSTVIVTADGYKKWSRTVNLSDGDVEPVNITLQQKSRVTAGLLSTLLPGWGQMYMGYGTKGFLVLLAHAGVGVYGAQLYKDYSTAEDEYDMAVELYQQATLPDAMAARKLEMEAEWEKLQEARSPLKSATYILGGFYLLNILDSVIFRPQLPRLNLLGQGNPHFNLHSRYGALSLGLSINF